MAGHILGALHVSPHLYCIITLFYNPLKICWLLKIITTTNKLLKILVLQLVNHTNEKLLRETGKNRISSKLWKISFSQFLEFLAPTLIICHLPIYPFAKSVYALREVLTFNLYVKCLLSSLWLTHRHFIYFICCFYPPMWENWLSNSTSEKLRPWNLVPSLHN